MVALWALAREFSLVFIPLFVVMDPLSIVPFLVPFLGSVPRERRMRVIYVSVLTGTAIGVLFLALGRGIFIVLGITESDFLVAGGLILLVLSLRELLGTGLQAPAAASELMAVVPIGTPLLVGPATISMLIVLSGLYGLWLVVIAFLVNTLIALVIFAQAQRIASFLGQGGLQAFSKVAYLLLAAIAVQLIRQGVLDFITSL